MIPASGPHHIHHISIHPYKKYDSSKQSSEMQVFYVGS